MLDKVRTILVQSSHPGNIGSSARAIKNMGLSQLCLVAPVDFPSLEATVRAAHASDILNEASVVDTVTEALTGCGLVLGASARIRSVPWPNLTPRAAAQKIVRHLQVSANSEAVAILFGREKHGLSNEELGLCHYQIVIPANPVYASLNVAQSVQIISYEIYNAFLEVGLSPENLALREEIYTVDIKNGDASGEQGALQAVLTEEFLASADKIALFFEHLEKTLVAINFLDPKQPRQLMTRLKRLLAKANLTEVELNILFGILTAYKKSI